MPIISQTTKLGRSADTGDLLAQRKRNLVNQVNASKKSLGIYKQNLYNRGFEISNLQAQNGLDFYLVPRTFPPKPIEYFSATFLTFTSNFKGTGKSGYTLNSNLIISSIDTLTIPANTYLDLGGFNLTNNGTMSVSGTIESYTNETFTNNGKLTFNSGSNTQFTGASSTFINSAGVTADIGSNVSLTLFNNSGVINNRSSIIITNSSGNPLYGPFINTGTITNFTGSVFGNNNANLVNTGGTFIVQAGVSVSNSGTFRYCGGNVVGNLPGWVAVC